MNAFRGRLMASGFTPVASMGMFDNWMGSGNTEAPKQTQPQNNGNGSQQQTNQNPNVDPNLENNDGTNQDLIATIWDEAKGEEKPGSKAGDPPVQQQQQPVQKTDEQLRGEVSSHLSAVGLGDIQLSAQDVEKFSGEQGHQEFANFINTRMQQVYLQAIQSSQRLFQSMLDAQIPKAVDSAFDKSKSFFEGNNLRSVLRSDQELGALMNDPATGPIVETVMRQFLVKGSNKDKALEQTKQYFQRVRKAMDPDYIPVNRNSRSSFRGDPRTAVNFLDVLKGK